MKKLLCFILCVSLLTSIICLPVSATEDAVVTENTEEFCEDLTDLVEEYDDAEYITPDASVLEAEEAYGVEDMDIKYCSRLIVQTDKPIEKYNAVDVISGFSNFYIVQFENEEDTNYAYEKYSADEDVLSVKYDVSYNVLVNSDESTILTEDKAYENFKNSWCHHSTGMVQVLEKYKDVDLPEIVIAVIDTGFDFKNTYFSDRIIPTGFNNAGDGDENSEQDYEGHGTQVSSVIANFTTDNVKIANYRFLDSKGGTESIALGAAAILKAVDDGADAINCSFMAFGADELYNEAIDYAYEHSCAIFASAGNWGNDIDINYSYPLVLSPKTVTVSAHNIHNTPTYCSGGSVDVIAPGIDVPLISLDNVIGIGDGTSYSSPFMASVYAMLYAVNPTMPFEDRLRAVKNSGDGTFEVYIDGWYGSGCVNALKLFGLDKVSEPVFSHNERKYDGAVSLEITCEEDAEVYYTLDGTYPSKDNGILYEEPVVFENEEMRIRAVAYKNGEKSNCTTRTMVSTIIGTDDMFTITEEGVITSYNGTASYLTIPEKINGITVVDIIENAFTSEDLYGIVLPDTVKYLGCTDDDYDRPLDRDEQFYAFRDCTNLQYIWGDGIEVLGYNACVGYHKLYEVFFPNCRLIYPRAFNWSTVVGLNFPKVKTVGYEAFEQCVNLRELYLPECEEIGYGALNMQTQFSWFTCDLKVFYAPKANYLKEIEIFGTYESYTVDSEDTTTELFVGLDRLYTCDLPSLETIGKGTFKCSSLNRLELSAARYIYSLPDALDDGEPIYDSYHRPLTIELSLPSTLEYCVPAGEFKNEYIEYVVYGTEGKNSYAEKWANANNIPFINISQETAIVEDVESVWDKYSGEKLEFDARGFNRTYQWYGSNDKIQGNYDDKLIAGATDKTFNPNEYKAYQYYYCVMTSTDKNVVGEVVSEVTIKSSMCHNRLYYMFALDDTYINFPNNLIYTKTTSCRNILNIVGVQENTNYSSLPSMVYKNYKWYGTGAEFVIYDNGKPKETYTLIVEGDVNGDSSVDVVDASIVAMACNGLSTLDEEYYFLAADTNADEVVDTIDYQSIVNKVLA